MAEVAVRGHRGRGHDLVSPDLCGELDVLGGALETRRRPRRRLVEPGRRLGRRRKRQPATRGRRRRVRPRISWLRVLRAPLGHRARVGVHPGTGREVIERVAKRRRRRQPAIRIALECIEDHAIELRRAARVAARWRHDVGLADPAHRLEVGARREQRGCGDQLPRDDAEREDVGDRRQRNPERSLGRHVAELALHQAALGVELAAARLGDPEIDHLEVTGVRHDQVRRRDVAVHDLQVRALLVDETMCVVERVAQLTEDRQHDRKRDRFVSLVRIAQELAQIEAGDQLHRDVVDAGDPAEVVDLRDVRMLQERRDLCLADERVDERPVLGEVGQHPLQRDAPLEPLDAALLRAIHGRHPAQAETLVQLVRSELIGGFGVRKGRHDALAQNNVSSSFP